jgi:hypothetical protein
VDVLPIITGIAMMHRNLISLGVSVLLGAVPIFGCVSRSGDKTEATSDGSMLRDSSARDTVTHLSSSAPVELGAQPVRVVLGSASEKRTLGARLETLASNHGLHLVLYDVRAESPPGTLYHLYLDLPVGAVPEPNDPHHIGSVNFYDAMRDRGPSTLGRSYDITAAVRKLKDAKMLPEETSVTIVTSRPPEAGARPVIGRIQIVEQS